MSTPEIGKPLRQFVQGLDNLAQVIKYVDELKSLVNDGQEIEVHVARLQKQRSDMVQLLAQDAAKVEASKANQVVLKKAHDDEMKKLEQEFIAQREALAEVKALHKEALADAAKEQAREKAQIAALMVIERDRLAELLKEEEAVSKRIAALKATAIASIQGIT
jgi:hypothetical protein